MGNGTEVEGTKGIDRGRRMGTTSSGPWKYKRMVDHVQIGHLNLLDTEKTLEIQEEG